MKNKIYWTLLASPVVVWTILMAGTAGTIFGSWWDLSNFKTTIVTEGQNALTWVIWIVIGLIGLYLLPVILRYLGTITWAMRGAMSNFFWGRRK